MKTSRKLLAAFLSLMTVFMIIPFGIINANAANASWTINKTTDITDVNAKISSKVTFGSSMKCTEGGFYIGTSSSNLKKNAYPDKCNIKSTYINSSFLMSKYKETLKANTTYYFKIYVIANGTTYTSPVNSFKTAAAPAWKLNSVTNISVSDAKISSKITFPSQRTLSEGGFYIGTSSSNLRKNSYPDTGLSIKSTYFDSSFLMSKYKESLQADTTYYYKIYVIVNGTRYESPIGNFKTSPGSSAKYTLTYNANGGSSAPAAQTGASTYKISSTIPTRNGYTFLGWATSNSAASAEYSAGNTITINKNTTLYAVWKAKTTNIYNLGEETYSFSNFSYKGTYNCFGMSITSSGYYIGALNINSVGGKGTNVNALSLTNAVRDPIVNYQKKQGSAANKAIVAGGKGYKSNFKSYDIKNDWNEVINYVKDHSHDDKGDLQIGIRQGSGGHSFNFLRYKVVNGQERIYAYDNNHPKTEIYLYRDSNGWVKRAFSSGTVFSNDSSVQIKCIALRSVSKYFNYVDGFKDTRAIYADTASIYVEGVEPYYLDADSESDSKVLYEIPNDSEEVTIIPLTENAKFEYLDEEYNFGDQALDTYGVFTLVNEDDSGVTIGAGLTIYKKLAIENLDDITLNYKSSAKINPQISIADGTKYTIKYESSNPKVASVDNNGSIYAGKKGTADIKVTVTDENGSTVTDTCKVTVKYSFAQWLIIILLFGWIWY